MRKANHVRTNSCLFVVTAARKRHVGIQEAIPRSGYAPEKGVKIVPAMKSCAYTRPRSRSHHLR